MGAARQGELLFARNRKKVMRDMPQGALGIVNSNDQMPRNGDLFFPYRQHSDMLYLTGIVQEKTVLLLFPSHPREEFREILFLADSDPVEEEWTGRRLSIDETRQISGIHNIKRLRDLDQVLHRLLNEAVMVMFNLNEYPKFQTDVVSRDHRFARTVIEKYPGHPVGRLAPLLSRHRMVKEEEELAFIREALVITSDAFFRALEFIRPGVAEYEVHAEILHEMIRQGSSGPAYPCIIASGNHACTMHYIRNSGICEAGDLLLMDIGAEFQHYAADITRTVPVSGKYTAEQRELYDAVERVMKMSRDLFRPGETIEGINRKARLMMADELVGIGMLRRDDATTEKQAIQAVQPFMKHGITHHLGLDVHDIVIPDEPLKIGMIMTCEPGLYIQEMGIGIRIENDILVGEPPTDLCEGIPTSADEIEAFMSKEMYD